MPIAGQAYSFVVTLISQATPNAFQVAPTLATGDVKVSTDFGAPVNLATLPTVIGASALVRVNLAAGEVGARTDVLFHDAAGDEWVDFHARLDAADTPPTVAAVADAVWDEDATGHQTLGAFGQAIGDPVADTNTIYKAVVTDAAGATVGVDVVAVKAETASIQADTDNLQTRLPAALVAGRIDASVGAMAADVVTAAAIAADAIGASELAADAVTEIADGLLKRDLSAVTGEAARSPLNALRFLRNKWSVTAGILTVTKEDDATIAWTAATTGTGGADPITTVDPA